MQILFKRINGAKPSLKYIGIWTLDKYGEILNDQISPKIDVRSKADGYLMLNAMVYLEPGY